MRKNALGSPWSPCVLHGLLNRERENIVGVLVSLGLGVKGHGNRRRDLRLHLVWPAVSFAKEDGLLRGIKGKEIAWLVGVVLPREPTHQGVIPLVAVCHLDRPAFRLRRPGRPR